MHVYTHIYRRCDHPWRAFGARRPVRRVGRSDPNLEPGTMRVYVTNSPRLTWKPETVGAR